MSASTRKLDLSRANSICPTPETLLLDYVKKNEIVFIRTLIEANPDLLHHEYPSTTKTILPTACCEEGVAPETVQTLIDSGGKIEGNSEWKPLHLAAQNSNSEILQVILNNIKGTINDTVDGNNALHSLVKGLDAEADEAKFAKNVELLLKAGINVNQGDGKNVSPILWAARNGYKTIIKTILDHSICHVDLDSHKLRNKSARELITEKRLYDKPLPERIQYQCPKEKLFSLLKLSREDEFITYFDSLSLTNPSDFVNADDNTATMLQYACEKGLTSATIYLLDKGADVNLTTKNQEKSPIEISAENGFYKVFETLLNQSDLILPGKILCYLLTKLDNPKFENIDHEKCCNLMLLKMESNRATVDVNGEDYLKNTPIHYALRYADEAITKKLLNLGASLACKNHFDVMPIEDIKPELLEQHLDDCIKFDINNKNDDKRNFEVIFDYHTLLPPRTNKMKFHNSDVENLSSFDNVVPETEVISYMSKASEFKPLLKHPVIVSFLFMKWHRIRWLFYTNLIFYVLFVLSLVTYIFTYYDMEPDDDFALAFGKLSLVTLNLTFWVLILRELFQITVSPGIYFRNFENYVEIVLIIITGMILYIESPSSDMKKQLSALVILLAAFELVLMVGQHPKLSTNVVMLKTVSVNFFKLLLWYSLLIIAFALSFYILFAKTEVPQNVNGTEAENDDLFTGPGKSLFKTIVMLTGEFDAGSINFYTYPVTSKLIFSLFVFMITIILLNLLNGLAVSDTQTIKNDAELVGHVTRAQHIYYVECMLLGNIIPTSIMRILNTLFCCCPCENDVSYNFITPFVKRVCLFNNSQNLQLIVLPNYFGKIFFEFEGMRKRQKESLVGCNRPCSDIYLDKETIKRTRAIIKKRRQASEEALSFDFEQLQTELAALKEKVDRILTTLITKRSDCQ